jgi:hypothetical protein
MALRKLISILLFKKEDNRITYFNGMMPVFVHDKDDLNTFRMITSQFYVNGNVTQAEICRAFGLPAITVKRAVKKYRELGPSGFYEPKKTRGATVLTIDVLQQAQSGCDHDLMFINIKLQLESHNDQVFPRTAPIFL